MNSVGQAKNIPKDWVGFDIDSAVERMSGNPTLWWEALAVFVDRYRGWDTAWAPLRGDRERERQHVHTLRSAASHVGAQRLVDLAGQMEAVILGGGDDEALRWQLRAAFREAWRRAEEAERPAV